MQTWTRNSALERKKNRGGKSKGSWACNPIPKKKIVIAGGGVPTVNGQEKSKLLVTSTYSLSSVAITLKPTIEPTEMDLVDQ